MSEQVHRVRASTLTGLIDLAHEQRHALINQGFPDNDEGDALSRVRDSRVARIDRIIEAARTAQATDYDTLHAEAEALRAENVRLAESLRVAHHNLSVGFDTEASLTNQLEAARGLLEQRIPCDVMLPPATTIKRGCPLSTVLTSMKMREDVPPNQRVFHRAPEVLAEQGERQEAVAHVGMVPGTDFKSLDFFKTDLQELPVGTMFYTNPQPGPDVRGLAAFALEFIDGAWKGGSFDGADVQEAGVRHGLLLVEQREESCGEHCDCAEYGFPAECYRLTPALAAHRHAQRKGEQS